MLAIRLQRLGRKALPMYRVAVQESHRHPSSGRVVAYVGSYNPHNKTVKFDAEKVAYYLKNGAQPTPRVVRLLQSEKIELPAWVKVVATDKSKSTKNPEKLRKNQPKEAAAPEAADEPVAEEPAVEAEAPTEAETSDAE